ncbi:tRNA (adenosine(37)-N6)-threonylcarbamoyltransferase complex dimerization subunit type 1 TsaB [Duganella aceris]|uniref:tRNA (Adenosine(37)-N6)-threonylcarbamoyltransferase complex dimerization subunit type 1 TsaB n=1 Tax=Duganella aceris TaxID=2703883 RepID=A0ABX0FH68_9BURK|nr:tRNA (adenosine(37)-N6)-threonylcarbamoyltransferase complex dimerization subunit type 1 TsaB [Duganella aceris]NGZ83865.1 tRNA (adenosine(37)-N6)-threonylcarbamoyltransferase complex dimerization subunit type 1 TsaB [Duganella aceris]
MPTILAIETSSELASCALLRGETVITRVSEGVRTHSQSILPMVQELLAEAGISLKDCDAIAFGSGPGSFTGVRTACGIAQGLAFGGGLPVVPVVTLDAMALACHQQHGAGEVLAVLDARMGEVYWAQYSFGGDGGGADDSRSGRPVPVLAPALSAPGDVRSQGAPVACGNGLSAYAEAYPAGGHATVMPHAAQIAQLAAIDFAAGKTVTAAEAQPLYLRNKIAYTQAERRDMAAAKAAEGGA